MRNIGKCATGEGHVLAEALGVWSRDEDPKVGGSHLHF